MPVPEGQITTSDLWKGEKKDDMPAVPGSSAPQQATGTEEGTETTQ